MILPASARRPCCSKQQFMKSRRSKHTLALRIAFGMNETWPRNCRCRRREIWPARPAGLFRGVCYRRMLPPSPRQLSPFDHIVRNSANRKLVVPLESLDNSQSCRKRVLVVWFLLYRTGRNICIVRGETAGPISDRCDYGYIYIQCLRGVNYVRQTRNVWSTATSIHWRSQRNHGFVGGGWSYSYGPNHRFECLPRTAGVHQPERRPRHPDDGQGETNSDP